MNISILIGLGAGLASSALFASAWSGTALGVLVLFFLSPMPVAIAGLGWGWASGAVAAATGTLIVGITGQPASGVIYLLALGAPSAVFAYYAQLNRSVTYEAADSSLQVGVQWYPLGLLVAWACVWGGVLASLSMFSIGSDVDAIRSTLQQVLEKTLFQDVSLTAGRALTADEKTAFAAMMTQIYPWAIATLWLAIAMFNWWGAAHVTARSGRLLRPWPDLSVLRLPAQVPLAFGLSLAALALTSGMATLVAAGFVGAFMFALMLVGLGVLHRVTRGVAARPFLLGIVYAALIVMPFISLVAALIGLGEPYIRNRMPPAGPAPPSHPAA